MYINTYIHNDREKYDSQHGHAYPILGPVLLILGSPMIEKSSARVRVDALSTPPNTSKYNEGEVGTYRGKIANVPLW